MRQDDITRDDIIDVEFEPVNDVPAAGRALLAQPRQGARPHAAGLGFSFRADALFLAQLIAVAANAPQSRALRRATPEDALKSYRGSTRREGQPDTTGKMTSREV